MARGALPDSHPPALGMPGMHGTYAAVGALQASDLLVALGARFDDRVTGKLSAFAPKAKVIHADIDPAEIGKNRGRTSRSSATPTRSSAGSRRDPGRARGRAGRDSADWWVTWTAGWKRSYPLGLRPAADDGPLKPQHVVERLRADGRRRDLVAGVGQHQMHASQHYAFTKPRSWINSGGLGTMGFAVPAAMGAQVGRPDAAVVAIDGDGCFQMTAQELATCAIKGIPIKVLIFNNGFLGMVRQWQELFYDERYSTGPPRSDIPDYVKLAEAYGCVGLRCEQPGDVDAVLEKALVDRPTCPVVSTSRPHDARVFPMVPSATPNDDIVLAPEFIAPEQAAGEEVIAS